MLKLLKSLLFLIILSTVSCGYFLYPERVGNKKGRIDTGVAILDGAGLILGIIPGVVAFAVDITTGAIYLPHGQKSAIDKHIKKLSESAKKPDGKELAYLKQNHEKISKKLAVDIGFSPDYNDIKYFIPLDRKKFSIFLSEKSFLISEK